MSKFRRVLALVSLTWMMGMVDSTAQAAQDARVSAEEANIYAESSTSSEVLAEVVEGHVLRLSTESESGWFKVLLPQPKEGKRFGWIQAKDVSLTALASELNEAGVQLGNPIERDRSAYHRVVVTGLASVPVLFPYGLQDYIGTTNGMGISTAYGGEFGYRVTTTWTVLLAGGYHFYSEKLISTLLIRTFSIQGISASLLAENTLIHSLPWKVGVAFGGGALLSTQIRTTGVPLSGNVVESDGLLIPIVIGKLTGRFYPIDNLGLVAAAGVRVALPVSGVQLGALTADLNLTAPFAEAGLQFEF